MWGVGCGVWGVGCGVWGVGCGVQRVGCGVKPRPNSGLGLSGEVLPLRGLQRLHPWKIHRMFTGLGSGVQVLELGDEG